MHDGTPCDAAVSGPLTGVGSFTTVGTPTFQVISEPDAGNVGVTLLQPHDWTGVGQTPEYGQVTWSFDLTRPVQNSTITPLQGDAPFPASGDLYFHIRGTIGSLPNSTFQSREPLHLHANLNSFSPFNDETFTLATPVVFEDVNTPGQEAFTLNNITLRLDH